RSCRKRGRNSPQRSLAPQEEVAVGEAAPEALAREAPQALAGRVEAARGGAARAAPGAERLEARERLRKSDRRHRDRLLSRPRAAGVVVGAWMARPPAGPVSAVSCGCSKPSWSAPCASVWV